MISEKNIFCRKFYDDKICSKCIRNNKNILIKFNSIIQYRKLWKYFLNNIVDEIDAFSNSSKEIIVKYLNIKDDKIKIIPHNVKKFRKIKIKPHQTFNIAIVGNISIPKGYNILKDIDKNYNKSDEIQYFVFGNVLYPLQNFKIYGEYNIDKLEYLLEEANIDLVFFPSVWPETFSYVTSELINMNIPIVSFNIGAQAEKINLYDKGYLINSFDTNIIKQELLKIKERVRVLAQDDL